MTAIQSSIGKMLLRTAVLALAVGGPAGWPARAAEATLSAPLAILGNGAEYGDDAIANHPTIPASQFRPTHHVVVYLEFGNGGQLIARHAYFPGFATPAGVKCAIDFLRRYDPATHAEPEATDVCQLYKYPIGNTKPVAVGFDDFTFASQGQIVIYVENKNYTFNEVAPITFTGFGAFDRRRSAGLEEKDPNRSFYNTRILPDIEGYKVLVIDNYYLGVRGRPIGPAPTYNNKTQYSMNINLITCRVAGCTLTDTTQVIPITVDPDTGNGWGYGP
jgi:hypothetical protein